MSEPSVTPVPRDTPSAEPANEAFGAHAATPSSEQQLAVERAAREQAEAMARAHDRFLGALAHDLRSPLNSIQSWAEVLKMQIKPDSPALMTRALAGIRNGVEQQVRLIENLLDTTRILNGTVALNPGAVSLGAAARAAVSGLSEAASRGNVRIVEVDGTSGPIDGPDEVDGDPSRIEQIVRLLLEILLDHAPGGSEVRIALSRHEGVLCLRVEGQSRNADTAVDGVRTRTAEGAESGMGLTLARRLAELQSGRIDVVPSETGGSFFEVSFPVRIPR